MRTVERPGSEEVVARAIVSGEVLGIGVEVVHVSGARYELYRSHPSLGYELGPETTFRWFCTVKVVVTFALLRLLALRGLDVETHVSEILPAYRGGGRELVRVRHLLAHTSGLPPFPTGRPGLTFAESALETPPAAGATPGSQCAYNYCTAWLVAGRLIEELSGLSVEGALEELVFEPLELEDSSLSCASDRGRRLGERIARLVPGHGLDADVAWLTSPDVLASLPEWNGGVGTLRDLAALFNHILSLRLADAETPDHELAHAMSTLADPDLYDESQARRVQYALGTTMAVSNSGFGRGWSNESFGLRGSIYRWPVIEAWAEPKTGTSAAIAFVGIARANVSYLQRLGTALRKEWRSLASSAE